MRARNFWIACAHVMIVQLLGPDDLAAQARPDLVAAAVSVPYGVLRGDSLTVSTTVRNAGTATAAGGWMVQVYLSADTAVTTSDQLLSAGVVSVPLAAGAASAQTVRVLVPASTAWGSYYVVVVLDPANRVIEANERNNITASTTRLGVIPKIDLVVASVSAPMQVIKGVAATVTINVRNTGTEMLADAIPSDVYLSTDRTYAAGDLLIGSFTVPAGLGPGGSTPVSTQITIPTAVQLPEPWYVIAVVDSRGRMPEMNENNNAGSSMSATTGPRPLLAFFKPSVPATAVVGQLGSGAFVVEINVQNKGLAPSTNLEEVRYYLSPNSNINGMFEGTFISNEPKDLLLATAFHDVALAPGSSKTLKQELKLPVGSPIGPYYIGVEVGDNSASSHLISAARPGDLEPTSVQAPEFVEVGSSFDVTMSVSNVGLGTVSPGWTSGIQLTGPAFRPLGDFVLGTDILYPENAFTKTVRVTVPAGVPPGLYDIEIMADRANTVYEETRAGGNGKANNARRLGKLRVQGFADVSVTVAHEGATTSVEMLNSGPHMLDLAGPNNVTVTVTATADSLGQQVLNTVSNSYRIALQAKQRQVVSMPALPAGTVYFLRASIAATGILTIDKYLSNNVFVNPQRYVVP